MTDAHRGAKIGTRVSMLVSHAIVSTHKRLIGTKHKLAMIIFRAISDEISAEVDTTIGPILRDLADRYQEDGRMRGLVDFMATNHGQLKALAGTGLVQQGLLWPISQILNNELAPLVYDALRHSPVSIPDAGTVAGTAAQGTTDYAVALDSLAAWGYSHAWGQSMIALAQNWPTYDMVITMFNRGYVSETEAKTLLKRSGLPDETIAAVFDLHFTPLSPADAALAVLRGNISQAEGAKAAQASGVDAAVFDVLISNTGEPPGLMQLLEAYRRGIIDRATLEHGIKQSRVRDEWISMVEALRYVPMSVSDAVNAFVQNHISQAEMRKRANDNGLQPGEVDILAETAGEPLSRTEASELVNRGLMTEPEFVQDLRESRLKDKYINWAYQLRRRLLEPRMLSGAVQSGSVAHDYAIQVAMEYGYNRKDAEILVSHGSMSKLQTYRDRVVSAIESLYVDDALTEDQAAEMIKQLGFEDSEARFILEAASFRKNARVIEAAISAIRSKFVGRHITKNEATGLLDALGVPSGQRDSLLQAWEIEVAANVAQLSEAQIVKAVNTQLITQDEGLKRLMAKGYSEGDATLLLQGA